jgi:hypothetical protein
MSVVKTEKKEITTTSNSNRVEKRPNPNYKGNNNLNYK